MWNHLNGLQHHPFVRGSVSYALVWTISTLGHQIVKQQKCVYHRHHLDWFEVRKMAFYGGFIISPCIFFWTSLMDKIYSNTSFRVTIFKGIFDQCIFAPIGISVFYIATNILDGKGHHAGFLELKQKFFMTYKSGCMYWPFMRIFNYSFIPPKNRVVFASFASLLWSTYLLQMIKNDKECKDRKDYV